MIHLINSTTKIIYQHLYKNNRCGKGQPFTRAKNIKRIIKMASNRQNTTFKFYLKFSDTYIYPFLLPPPPFPRTLCANIWNLKHRTHVSPHVSTEKIPTSLQKIQIALLSSGQSPGGGLSRFTVTIIKFVLTMSFLGVGRLGLSRFLYANLSLPLLSFF